MWVYLCNLLFLGVVLFGFFRFGGRGIILLYPCISGFFFFFFSVVPFALFFLLIKVPLLIKKSVD